jgi:hypothetical protein
VFAQIASGFDLMVDVDWTTIFKTFYEVVRIKVACRDSSKIPKDRLYEMNKDLFVVSFEVEGGLVAQPKQPGNDDGGGNDDDKKKYNGEEDDDEDLLDDVSDLAKDNERNDKDKTTASKNGQGSVAGARKVTIGLDHSDYLGQEEQLIACMSEMGDKLLTAMGRMQVTNSLPLMERRWWVMITCRCTVPWESIMIFPWMLRSVACILV